MHVSGAVHWLLEEMFTDVPGGRQHSNSVDWKGSKRKKDAPSFDPPAHVWTLDLLSDSTPCKGRRVLTLRQRPFLGGFQEMGEGMVLFTEIIHALVLYGILK